MFLGVDICALGGGCPQLYADKMKCVASDLALLLSALRITTGYVLLVEQEPAPSKCVLLSISREVRKDLLSWVLTDVGERWTVKFDVRDLGGHNDTSLKIWPPPRLPGCLSLPRVLGPMR